MTEPPSLYYNWGNNFECKMGQFQMKNAIRALPRRTIYWVISSAPLSNSGELILDTHTRNCAEYPSDMVFGRQETLNSSTHSKSDSEEDGCLHSRSTPGLRCGGLQTANQVRPTPLRGKKAMQV